MLVLPTPPLPEKKVKLVCIAVLRKYSSVSVELSG
jgi:hypothetical protein